MPPAMIEMACRVCKIIPMRAERNLQTFFRVCPRLGAEVMMLQLIVSLSAAVELGAARINARGKIARFEEYVVGSPAWWGAVQRWCRAGGRHLGFSLNVNLQVCHVEDMILSVPVQRK